MASREKVIEGIEAIREFFGFGLPSQPPVFEAYQRILTDAINLLKEQEAVEPKHNPLSPTDWFCGKCGMCISRFHDYCPSCGREVKWDA